MTHKEKEEELIMKESNLLFTIMPPDYVGGYRLGKKKSYTMVTNLTYKPNWLHRQCMRIFLGWYWEDKK
jgi:hypothetical protein